MYSIAAIRENPGTILAVGAYRPGYQAILDFDVLIGRASPSIIGIVGLLTYPYFLFSIKNFFF